MTGAAVHIQGGGPVELARWHLVAEGLVRPGHWVSRQERSVAVSIDEVVVSIQKVR